jgi:glycosyltransferase involved in cell wall biosynthesis
MRVLMLTPFYRPVIGGISRYVEGLVVRLTAAGHEVLVGTSVGGASEKGVVKVAGSWAAVCRQVVVLAKGFRPDVIHVHGHWALLLAAHLARRATSGARVIFTFHTSVRPRGVRGRIFRRLLNRCDFVTAVSSDLLARETRQLRILTQVAVTYPGATPADGAAEGLRLRRNLGISPSTLLLVSVAPLHYPLKVAGLVDLLRALAEVTATPSDVSLLVAGDGPYRPLLERLAVELRLGSSVRFLGAVDPVAPLYDAADVVCHISYQDELPLVVLEAMAHGKPLLCTPVGGVPEVLPPDAAVYVEGGVPQIAAGLRRILGDAELRARLGALAAARVRRNLSWSNAVASVLATYGVPSAKRIHFSVDVEEDYRMEGPSFRGVTEALPRVLELFERHAVSASFFLTNDVVERFPELTGQLESLGHHVGSHGISHSAPHLAGRSLATQMRDISSGSGWLRARRTNPRSFRGPNFRVDSRTFQALDQSGFQVDSSVLPGRVVRRTLNASRQDFRGAPQQPYHVSPTRCTRIGSSSLIEIPVASNPVAPGSPLGLGFLNLAGVGSTVEALRRSPATDIVFLIHPWEAIDYPPGSGRPAWMNRGCRSDLSLFDQFLGGIRKEHSIVPFASLLDTPLSSNRRWWSPGPWGEIVPRPTVFLVTSVFRPVIGGISTYVSTLAGALESSGFRVNVLAYPASLVMREAQPGRSMLRKLLHGAFVAWVLLRVAALRLRGEPVLVHSHGSSFCLVASALSRLMGAVTLHTFHSVLNYRSRILEWFAPRVDGLLFVAQATKRLYERHNEIAHDCIGIAPGGAPPVPRTTDLERANARSLLGVPDHAFLVLFVGRVVPEKGVDLAVEATAILHERRHNVVLFVAGPHGPGTTGEAYVARLEALARERGIADRVRLFGRVPESRLEELFRGADALVLPSRWEEPAPLVAMEGMMRGLPVVATSVGGLDALVRDGETGILVPRENAPSLAEAVRRLVADPQLASRLGAAGRDWALENATDEAVARFHSRVYRALWRDVVGR